MQEIAVNGEINFHEQEVVSVFHETNSTGRDEQFAELVFAGAFAIRSISNLGPSQVTDSLGECLELTGRMIVEAAAGLTSVSPTIIAYPGHAGRKQFLAMLRFSSRRMQLDYSAKGFGWFGTGLGYYCPASVHSLFRYFAHRRNTDEAYLSALANVAVGCARLQATKQIKLTNHPQLVMMIVGVCMEHFIPEWW